MELLNDINNLDINSDEIWNLIDSLEVKNEDVESDVVESCPSCNSSNLYTDKNDGVIVCSECG